MESAASQTKDQQDTTAKAHDVVPNLHFSPGGDCILDHVPDDVLEGVFWVYCELLGFHPVLSVRILKNVCRRWRRIVDSTSGLWSHIRHEWIGMTHFLLKRSRLSLLSIHVTLELVTLYMDVELDEALKYLTDTLEHVERIKDLHLRLDYDEFPAIEPYLKRLAPCLQELSLSVNNKQWFRRDSVFLPYAPTNRSPSLSHLRLSGIGFPWQEAAVHWSRLKCLTLRDIPQQCRMSLRDALALLSKTPLLETLEWVGVFIGIGAPNDTEEWLPVSESKLRGAPGPVPLPYLSHFALDGEYDVAIPAELARRISVPQTCIIEHCIFGANTDFAFRAASYSVPHLKNIIPASMKPQIREIHTLKVLNDAYIQFTMCEPESGAVRGREPWRFHIVLEPLNGGVEEVRTLCELTQLSHVQVLEVGMGPRVPSNVWVTVFSRCENIRQLTIEDSGAVTSLTAIVGDKEVRNNTVIFPKLEHLRVGTESRWNKLSEDEEQALVDALHVRRTLGYALASVEVFTASEVKWNTLVPPGKCTLRTKERRALQL